jgi:hypothetical protein
LSYLDACPKNGLQQIPILLKAITTCKPLFTWLKNLYFFTNTFCLQVSCALRTLQVGLMQQIHNIRNNLDMLSQQFILLQIWQTEKFCIKAIQTLS